ncbi:MAG: integrase family protein [Burkholderiales bacterium]|nr:integrase family protein [Burkholderiales bacterium]
MARPKKDAHIDLSEAQELTAGLIERLTCPAGKPQTFMRDTKAPGLRVRATPASAKNPQGVKAFVFEAKLNRQNIRRTIGDVRAWTIDAARTEANRLRVSLDTGIDPREVERQQQADKAAATATAAANVEAAKVAALTVGEVWKDYIEKRRPFWGDLHYRDHVDKTKSGGLPSGRRGAGKQLTKPGPLAALMPLALCDLDQPTIEAWAAKEGKTRASSARLAWRLLTVFLTWCAEQPEYAALLPTKNPAKTKKAREALGRAGTKSDVLQREQLAVWFAAVQQLQNPVISACLQIMLLTGARPGEVLALRWEDINTQWKGIAIRDKVEGTREIPATPYMLHLMATLPRRNEWVFSSNTSATGCLSEPNNPHTRACRAAGLEGLTLHGLRRSFKSLTEWLEVPVGVVAQIQGHKPSATAEKHYTVRPLELLRVHHERIEAWILEQAGIVFDAKATPGKFQAVA